MAALSFNGCDLGDFCRDFTFSQRKHYKKERILKYAICNIKTTSYDITILIFGFLPIITMQGSVDLSTGKLFTAYDSSQDGQN